MGTALFTLTSSLHRETAEDVSKEKFITDIEAVTGEKFLVCGNDFSSYGTHEREVIYVRTGGTEGIFKSLGIKGNVRLLTSGQSNSLAASMEILSFLRQNGQSGEIIHGSTGYIASRLRNSPSGFQGSTPFVHPLAHTDLGGVRLGVIGKPSDWLISSEVCYRGAKERLNAELVDIPMEELLSRLDFPEDEMRSFKGSERIYDALREIIAKYGLGGITLRCFDLLDTVHNTGCLALARLNAEGIPSSCEGDIPALLSMVYLQKKKGCPGFQCNLSRINGDALLFAHCTIPLTMVRSYRYSTHFESGMGTAIKGELEEKEVEIFKISPDLQSYVSIPGKIIGNSSEENLCRTQVLVEAKGSAEYFLQSPLANHHIVSYL